MDLKKFDKNGKPLNLMEKSDRKKVADYYSHWLEHPQDFEPNDEDIKCELQLQALGDWEALNFKVDYKKFREEIKEVQEWWVPYLRREGISNDREGMLIVGLEGDMPNDSLSRPEAIKRTGRFLKESDFAYPTTAYKHLTSLHSVLDYWQPLGRTMIVKVNQGGWFPPHRDSPNLNRDCFRVVTFLGNASANDSYEWWLDEKRRDIVPNCTYYVDTRKVHRTHSWTNDSYHLILNVPKTWENVMKLMSVLRYY